MKKSTKKSILIGAAAALAASLVPYECKVEENGDFSFTSLLLGVYRRRRADGEKSAVTVTVANAPCFTAEAKARRDAALRHSIEAAAEREMFARMVLAEVEKDISSMLVDAANVYDENELAVRLRTMHLLYESVKNSGGTVVIPSAYSEGFADAGLDRAPDSLKSGK